MSRRQRPPIRWWPRARDQQVLATGERLRLTPMRADDAWAYADSLQDPDVQEWQGYDVQTIERMTLGYSAHLEARFRGHPTMLAIRELDSNFWSGHFGITQDFTDPLGDSVLLGWWLAEHARGRGLAHEALELVLRWLHDEVMVGTVRMGTRSDNERALKMIHHSGARFQHEHPTLLPNGTQPMGRWYVHEL
ncbi:MAG: GNAT family N-acetyltransferase [Ilumatobacteraceae bacterium]